MKLTPSDNPPPCQWFDQQDNPRDDQAHECGAPASHKVKVMGAFTKAFVFLCDEHNKEVHRGFANRRAAQST